MLTMTTTEFAARNMDSEFTRHCDEYMEQHHRNEITLKEAHERIGALTVVYINGCREMVRIAAEAIVNMNALIESFEASDKVNGIERVK